MKGFTLKRSVNQGFTLIELVLYVTMIAVVLGAMTPVAWEVVGGGAKAMVQQEVAASARNLAERIKNEIRNAKSVVSVGGSVLVLENYTGPNTTVDLAAGRVRIDEGGGPIQLNSQNTTVTSLVFSDYSSADAKSKNIQVAMTMEAAFSADRQEYQKSISVQTSAELRGI